MLNGARIKKLLVVGLLFAVALAGLARESEGGYRHITDPATYVNVAGRRATGCLGKAWNSSNSVEMATCETTNHANPALDRATCVFRDELDVQASCTTTAPSLIAAIRSVNSDACISATWDAGGQCLTLTIQNGSYIPPKGL